jgi:hypothetical protein
MSWGSRAVRLGEACPADVAARRVTRPLVRTMAWLLSAIVLVIAPIAGATLAVQWAPPAHVVVAGQEVSVKPVIGRNTTRIAGDAITRPEHRTLHLGPLSLDVGVDVGVDWNRLVPQDKQTRQYLGELFDDPTPAEAALRSSTRRHVASWAAVGAATVAVIEVVTWLVIRRRRRKLANLPADVRAVVVDHNALLRRVLVVGAAVTLVMVEVAAGRVLLADDDHVVIGSPVLNGTGLAGTHVDGLVGEVIPFLSLLRPHSPFYDLVADNLDDALAGVDVRADSDDVVFVEAEDLEDVNGMARIVGRTAQEVDADFITFSGDLTFAGKPLESYLIDTIDYYSDGVPVEFAPGLHDTPAILQAAQSRGWVVADDGTHEVAGVSILTLADPRISTVGDFGTGTVLRDEEVDVETFVTAAIAEACDSHPDLIVLHDHQLGRKIAEQGCQQLAVIDGRSFRRVGVQRRPTVDGGSAVEYTVGSAGGHVDTRPNPGSVEHPATFEIFILDSATHRLEARVVTVRPDASVAISRSAVVVDGQDLGEP